MLIRGFANSKTSSDLLPSYEKILSAKSKGYPKEIMVTESHAKVELQSLLDHTASRIMQLQAEVIQNIKDKRLQILIYQIAVCL